MTEYIRLKNIPPKHVTLLPSSSSNSSSSSYPHPPMGYQGAPQLPYFTMGQPVTLHGVIQASPYTNNNFVYPIYGQLKPLVHPLGYSASFNSGKLRLLPTSEHSSGLSSLQSDLRVGGDLRRKRSKGYRDPRAPDIKKIPRVSSFASSNNNISKFENKNLPVPAYPKPLSRPQPPEGVATYREPPILNDKLFPRDPLWNEEMGLPFGPKMPHLQMRGIVVEVKAGRGWTPLLDGISMEVKGGEIMAVITASGK